MCAKRGTSPTGVSAGDTDDVDGGRLGDARICDAEAPGDAGVGDPDAAGAVGVAGSWLTSAEALELRGWELVHPDTTRASPTATEHLVTLALAIALSPDRSGTVLVAGCPGGGRLQCDQVRLHHGVHAARTQERGMTVTVEGQQRTIHLFRKRLGPLVGRRRIAQGADDENRRRTDRVDGSR